MAINACFVDAFILNVFLKCIVSNWGYGLFTLSLLSMFSVSSGDHFRHVWGDYYLCKNISTSSSSWTNPWCLSEGSYCAKAHDERQLGEERVYFRLLLQVTVHHWGKSRREPEARTGTEVTKNTAYWLAQPAFLYQTGLPAYWEPPIKELWYVLWVTN